MNVKRRIQDVLTDMGFSINSNEDINLIEYGIDSLRFIEFIVAVEHEFGITIPDDALSMESVSSIDGFSSYIEALVDEN